MLSPRLTATIFAIAAGSGLMFTPIQDQVPLSSTTVKGQDVIGIPRASVARTDDPFGGPGFGQSAFGTWSVVRNPKQQMISSDIAAAVSKLNAAESAGEKRDAESALRDSLAADYELKMEQYDEHLKKLEDELDAMRDRLSKRRAAKDDMVDLRIKVLRAEADDLGWPSGPNRAPTYFSAPTNVTGPLSSVRSIPMAPGYANGSAFERRKTPAAEPTRNQQ